MFDHMMVRSSPEHDITVVLMLRVWVMYGKSKKLGLFLSAVFIVALATSLILPLKQPQVS